MSHRRTLVVAIMFLGLLFAGSAAGAIPSASIGHTQPDRPELRERLRTQFQHSLAGLKLPGVTPGLPEAPAPAATTTAVPSVDPFPDLPAGQFAAYASGTVNHTGAPLAGKGVDHDLNFATSHAAHSEAALPRWNSEIGRAAFPALAAGASQSKALAAELGEPDSDEENSVLPLDPAVAKAPPSSAPVVEETPVNVPPILKSKALRAEASARAVKTGCVLGSDFALGRANADDTDVGDLKGDPKSPAPLLSVSGDEPPRGVAQSLARTRLVPIAGQPSRFGVLAETRQTIAPVTLFKGDKQRELTIEVAGEWILRAVADGSAGSVTLHVEKSATDDRPLMRIISRDSGGKTMVTAIGDIDDLSNLDQSGIDLGNGLTLVLAEPPRALRGATGSQPLATGTRAVGALDILRLQSSDEPSDAIVRVGHMEAAVAVPAGGASCPGIGVAKRSSQPTVDAGGRFSWLLDISNPNDCVLDHVKLVDTTQPSKGLVYKVIATSPEAKVDSDTVTFDGMGPLQPGSTKALRIDVEVDPGSAAGQFTNQAVATGVCGSAAVSGAADNETQVEPPTTLNLVGRAGANEPAVQNPATRTGEASGPSPSPGGVVVHPAPLSSTASNGSATRTSSASLGRTETGRTAGALARTGGATTGALGIGLCGIGVLLRRFRPRRRR